MTSFRTILSAAVLLALAPITQAEDLLYVRTDNKLYACNTQTGELTYLTDGTLQWIASPSFDEPHHTALYVVPGYADGGHDGSYFWGNPVTGQSAGPYTATLSSVYFDYPPSDFLLVYGLSVYVPTTERLYAMGRDGPYGNIVPILVDQYNTAAVPSWGQIQGPGWSFLYATAVAYDPISDVILVGWSADSGDGNLSNHGIVRLDPHTGNWLDQINGPFYLQNPGWISSIAVDPSNGDRYYVQTLTSALGATTGIPTLYRNDQAIASGPDLANWALRFADAKWAELARPH